MDKAHRGRCGTIPRVAEAVVDGPGVEAAKVYARSLRDR
jgi:hypothetical protein